MKNNGNKIVNSVILLIFGQTKIEKKREFYSAKKPITIRVANVGTIVASKLIRTKTNSKYSIGYLDEVIIPSVLILPKISGYVKLLTPFIMGFFWLAGSWGGGKKLINKETKVRNIALLFGSYYYNYLRNII